jgi:DNA adenine methylase
MKPFLKWAGSKFKIVDRVRTALPQGSRLVEPFVGSGAVFMNTDFDSYLLADSNRDVIDLFNAVKHDGLEFIEYAKQLFLPHNNEAGAFYELRQEFNDSAPGHRRSALFVYLNRHCFNGLCRYNSKGKFNVPFGRYDSPGFPEAELIAFSAKSRRAEFIHEDFRTTMRSATLGDVVYCDPPYVPLSATANFSDYTAEGFGVAEQRELALLATELSARGVPVVISNHDTEFTRLAYQAAAIEAFGVQRFISSNAANRGKAAELLAVFS